MDWKTLFYAFPWMENSTMIEREHFDKEKIVISLRAKLKSIECSKAGCKHSSDLFDLPKKDPR